MTETGPRRVPLIDPSGRPLRRAGFEAGLALGVILAWMAVFGAILAIDHAGALGRGDGALAAGLAALCWLGAEHAGTRHHMIWPTSAFGICGGLSAGFAVFLSAHDFGAAPFDTYMTLVSAPGAAVMLAFLLRFKLPGLVSPVLTFSLVALFMELYGTDPARLRQLEGFSPRGIAAALLQSELWVLGFGLLGLTSLLLARRLDLKGDDFGLAAARPLHLIGGGLVALILGRIFALMPVPLDLILLTGLWLLAYFWCFRINRVAVLVVIHYAMGKPFFAAWASAFGVTLDLTAWIALFWITLIFDFALWPWGHKRSKALGWTLGPGGRVPEDRPGWIWRYWPYA